jgi:hypothetical protein
VTDHPTEATSPLESALREALAALDARDVEWARALANLNNRAARGRN